MSHKALSIYYGLAIFVLGTALFAMQPTKLPQVSAWQSSMRQQFTIAWKQTIGDGPWFEDVAMIYDGIADFYDQSANATIAMLAQPETDQDLIDVASRVYHDFAYAIKGQHAPKVAGASIAMAPMPGNFMSQEPIYNIIPYKSVVKTVQYGEVSGATISYDSPVNSIAMPWVTLRDNMTGQIYCLAVYDGAVNKYLGPCKYDYH